jgi:hypothetical protein
MATQSNSEIVPVHFVYDVETGETTETPLTAEEIAEQQTAQSEYVSPY